MTSSLNHQTTVEVNEALPATPDAAPPPTPPGRTPPPPAPNVATDEPPRVVIAAEHDDYDIIESDFGRPATETAPSNFSETTIVRDAVELAAVCSYSYVTLMHCY